MDIERRLLLQRELTEMLRAAKETTTTLVARLKVEPEDSHGGTSPMPLPTLQCAKRELLSPNSCVTSDNSVVSVSGGSAHVNLMREQTALPRIQHQRQQQQEINSEAVRAPEKLITALDMLCGSSPDVAAVSTPMKLVTAMHMLEQEPLTRLNSELEQSKSASVFESEILVSVFELEQLKENTVSISRENKFRRGPSDRSTGTEDDEDLLGQARDIRTSHRAIKPRNTNPGRRVQGGRLYDSALGKTCHWCRQKTVEHHVKCRECNINYCGPCLQNRMGENIREELAEGVRWLCPKCRNGCGPGCDCCCNCGPCRKALGKAPTGQMIAAARTAGFNNAHDYLVHLETGESATEIDRRKVGQDWTNDGRFNCKETSPTSASGEETSSSSHGLEEFTLNEETSTQLHRGILDMQFVKKFVEAQKRKRAGIRTPLPVKRSERKDITRAERSQHEDSCRVIDIVCNSHEKLIARRKAVLKYSYSEGKCTTQEITLVSSQNNWVKIRACEREHDDGSELDLENSTVAKKRELDEVQRLAILQGFSASSKFPIPSPAANSRIKPTHFSPGVENSLTVGLRRGSSVKSGLMECPINPQGLEYRAKLKSALGQAFNANELEVLFNLVRCRKRIQKLREMRGRTVDVVTEDKGLSYLDHHHDFAAKLDDAQSSPEKLALLRGFFFWLQHSCMEGAFKPWPTSHPLPGDQHGDCVVTEGPECQVRAVVLQLNENEANRPAQLGSMMTGRRQSLLSFQAKKKYVQHPKSETNQQLLMAREINYRVVLGLPAPALQKELEVLFTCFKSHEFRSKPWFDKLYRGGKFSSRPNLNCC